MANCESEPIHTPGSVQAYGALLVCDERWRIVAASENTETYLGFAATAVLGRGLTQLLPAFDTAMVGADLAANEEGLGHFVAYKGSEPQDRDRVDITASRRGRNFFVEVEHHEPSDASSNDAKVGPPCEHLRDTLHHSAMRLATSTSVQAMCDRLAGQVHGLFGYDRVLIYRFDAHWHGTVIAEAGSGALCSYLGHRFPSSDIPSQARDIFCRNMYRMIPDIERAPSPLLGDTKHGAPVDMTYCHLRSPSQIHLQYLASMGVRASLTLSLRHDGALWGLVACHHSKPRYLSAGRRHSAELMATLASALLARKEQQGGASVRQQLEATNVQLAKQMREQPDILAALCNKPITLQALSIEQGASCAIRLDGQWRTLGQAPSIALCEQLADWLNETHGDAPYYATASLPAEFAPAAGASLQASGLLAVFLPHSDGSVLLWFRPELLQEVHWAGNPHDNKIQDPTEPNRLHPRQSFARYREVVRGRSRAIHEEEIRAALALRKNLIEVDLAHKVKNEQRLRERAELEQQRAQQAVAAREHVLGIVSHDLRNPLNAISLSAQLMHRKLAQEISSNEMTAMLTRFLQKVDTATLRMRRLIEDVLSLAKMQGGTFEVEQAPVVGQTLLTETQSLLEPIAAQANLHLTVEAPRQDIIVHADRERLLQALGNLVGNAIKFTPEGGAITLHVERPEGSERATFCVADTGRGISPGDQRHIFDAYWQAHNKQSRLGAGLGLGIVKHIVEAHGGEVWVESMVGAGTKMWFSCPVAKQR